VARPSSLLVIRTEQRYWRRPVRMMNDYLGLGRKDSPLTAAAAIAVIGALGPASWAATSRTTTALRAE
jgi:hypothetical protein